MTRTDIAQLYHYTTLRRFNLLVISSGLHLALPKILEKKAQIFPFDMPIIEAHLGRCPRWEEYNSKKTSNFRKHSSITNTSLMGVSV